MFFTLKHQGNEASRKKLIMAMIVNAIYYFLKIWITNSNPAQSSKDYSLLLPKPVHLYLLMSAHDFLLACSIVTHHENRPGSLKPKLKLEE